MPIASGPPGLWAYYYYNIRDSDHKLIMTSMTERRWLKKTLTALRLSAMGLLLVVSLALITFYAVIYTYDIDSQRANIETYLSKLIDRKISIEGGLKLQASLGSVGIVARDVKVANANWSEQPWFAEAGELKGSISLFDLLLSKIVITNISLTSAKILIEKSQDGIANWPTGKPGNSPGGKYIIPSILNVQINDLELLIKINNRPDLNFKIQSAHASLPLGKPITLVAKGNYGDIPIQVALQGDTLNSMFQAGLDWPLTGYLTLPGLDINIDGSIKHHRDLFDIGLHLRDINQKPSDKKMYGWKNDGLEILDVKFNFKKQNNIFMVDLQGEIKNFELSHLGAKQKSTPNLKLNIGMLKVHSYGKGNNVNSIIQNGYSRYEIENSRILINPVNKDKHVSLSIFKMDMRISPDTKITTQVTGALDDKPIQATLEHGRLIDLAWSKQPWSYKAQVHLLDSQFNTAGKITNHTIAGQFNLSGKSLKKSLAYFVKKTADLGGFQLSGKYEYDQKKLNIKEMNLNFADLILSGEASVILSSVPKLSFSFETRKLSLDKLLKSFKKHSQYKLSAKTLRLAGNTQGKTFQEWFNKLNLALNVPDIAIDKMSDKILLLKDVKLDSSASDSFTASAAAISQGVDFNVALHSSPLQSIFSESSMPVVMDIKNSGASLKFDGKATGLKPGGQEKLAVAGSLVAKIQNLSKVIDRHKLKLPGYKNISIKAIASINEKAFLLSSLNVHSDEMSTGGEVSYKPENGTIMVQLEDSYLDVAHLLAAYGPGKLNLKETEISAPETVSDSDKQRPSIDTQTIIPNKKINITLLNKLNADIGVKQLTLTYKKEPINTIGIKLRIHDGLLDFSYSGRSTQMGSEAKINLSLFTNLRPPRLEIKIDVHNLNYGYILKTFELTNAVRGAVNINVDLVANGDTTRELLQSAKGNIAFVSERGRVPRKLLELWGAGFLRILLPTTWIEEDSTQLNCAVGYFNVTDGFLKSEALLADTERVTVAGDIAVNLLDEKIQGIINTKSKSAALIKLATPIAVSGTIKHPHTAPAENKLVTIGKWLIGISQPYTIILLFGDLGESEKNPCAALLKITEEKEEPEY